MTVRPAWLQAVAPHGIPPGQIEARPGIADLRSDQAAQNVGLAAARCAGTGSPHRLERDVGFLAVGPRNGQLVANFLDRLRFKHGLDSAELSPQKQIAGGERPRRRRFSRTSPPLPPQPAAGLAGGILVTGPELVAPAGDWNCLRVPWRTVRTASISVFLVLTPGCAQKISARRNCPVSWISFTRRARLPSRRKPAPLPEKPIGSFED